MKKGLEAGTKSTVSFVVDKRMVAAFEGKTIHQVLSTFHLVYYAELDAQKVIEPFLEQDEEAVDFEICLKHTASTKISENDKIMATLVKNDEKKLTCEIDALNPKRKICGGTQIQALTRKGELN